MAKFADAFFVPTSGVFNLIPGGDIDVFLQIGQFQSFSVCIFVGTLRDVLSKVYNILFDKRTVYLVLGPLAVNARQCDARREYMNGP